MPKNISLKIDQHQAEVFVKAVRCKGDIIVLWMNAIKSFLAGVQTPDDLSHAQIKIFVKSMSRLFCELAGGEKIFSIAFPFTTICEKESIRFFSKGGVEIDSRVSSNILSLLAGSNILEASDFSSFIDPIIDASEIDADIWGLMRELMLAEDGYLRYDFDKVRNDGHKHPLNHLDLGYSSGATFKIGLKNNISGDNLVSILDTELDCHYLVPAH